MGGSPFLALSFCHPSLSLSTSMCLALAFNPKWKIKQQQNATRNGATVSFVVFLFLLLPFPFGQMLLFRPPLFADPVFALLFFGLFWNEIEWFLGLLSRTFASGSTYNTNNSDRNSNSSTCTMVKNWIDNKTYKEKYF